MQGVQVSDELSFPLAIERSRNEKWETNSQNFGFRWQSR